MSAAMGLPSGGVRDVVEKTRSLRLVIQRTQSKEEESVF